MSQRITISGISCLLLFLSLTVTTPTYSQKKKDKDKKSEKEKDKKDKDKDKNKKDKKDKKDKSDVQLQVLGTVNTAAIAEASGIAASKALPGCFWTHNDSGNKPEVFLLDGTGKLLSVISLNAVRNRDWEDIAEGVGPTPGKQYVYVGNIGNNVLPVNTVQVYRFEAPVKTPAQYASVTPHVLSLTYPDGARDAESLMIDPIGKSIYIISKREKQVSLYKAANLNFKNGDKVELQKVGTLPYTWITAGDISQDGHHIIIKNQEHIYYWHRNDNESVEAAMARPATELPYVPEKQGEALTFKTDNSGYITISEGKHPALNFYPHPF
jgi:hypothetical protein